MKRLEETVETELGLNETASVCPLFHLKYAGLVNTGVIAFNLIEGVGEDKTIVTVFTPRYQGFTVHADGEQHSFFPHGAERDSIKISYQGKVIKND